MAPITTAVVAKTVQSIAEKEALKAATGFLKDKVIGRWSEHRAERFLATFLNEVRKEEDVKTTSADLNDMLQLISKSEDQTSALFDAYRRVALSASKDIGPMVIGLLTARIVLQDREATEIEEMAFEGAEILKDKDFMDFQAWMNWVHQDHEYTTNLEDQRRVGAERTSIARMVKGKIAGATYLTPASPGASKSLTTGNVGQYLYQPTTEENPLNIFRDVGSFALKLRNAGLLQEEARARGRNQIGTNYFVLVSPACEELNTLSLRAAQAVEPC